jgi:transposase
MTGEKEYLMKQDFMRGISIPEISKRFKVDKGYLYDLTNKWLAEHNLSEKDKKKLSLAHIGFIERQLFKAIELNMDESIIDELQTNYVKYLA